MILGIETSGILCSIAWYENEHILLEYNIERNQVHSNVLADLFNNGMNHLNKRANDISLASIGCGPGSFTGLRIGMSFLKGLCFGSDIPIIGVSNFNVLALHVTEWSVTARNILEVIRSIIISYFDTLNFF